MVEYQQHHTLQAIAIWNYT